MNITINVDEVTLDSVVDHNRADGSPVTLADLVARQLVQKMTHEDSSIVPELRSRIERIRDDEIREQIRPQIDEAMAQPIQRTNEFGSPRGEPVTLAEMIVKEVHNFLNRLDTSGASLSSQRLTVAQKMVKDMVERTIKKDLAKAIEEEREKVVAAVRAKAADLIADAVNQGVGGRRVG